MIGFNHLLAICMEKIYYYVFLLYKYRIHLYPYFRFNRTRWRFYAWLRQEKKKLDIFPMIQSFFNSHFLNIISNLFSELQEIRSICKNLLNGKIMSHVLLVAQATQI